MALILVKGQVEQLAAQRRCHAREGGVLSRQLRDRRAVRHVEDAMMSTTSTPLLQLAEALRRRGGQRAKAVLEHEARLRGQRARVAGEAQSRRSSM